MRKRLLSTMLALCVMLTMLPISALATETTEETPETDNQTIEFSETEAPAEESSISDDNTENSTENQTIPTETSEPTPLADDAPTSGTCGENAKWEYDDYNYILTISGTGAIADYDTYGPWGTGTVSKIIIQDGITRIGNNAFWGLNFGAITFPESLKSIGDAAFFGNHGTSTCPSPSIVLPNSLTDIGIQAFSHNSIASVSIPSSVHYIAYNAFSYSELTDVNIMSDSLELGYGVFSSCYNLTNVTLSSGLKNTGSQTFSYCKNLTNVTIPNGVKEIGEYCFWKSGLRDVNLPNSVTIIERDAFSDCLNLSNVTFSKELTNIDNWAFTNCPKLTNIYIPDSVIDMGQGIFIDCTGLKNVVLPNNINKLTTDSFAGCTSLSSIVIPDAVTEIQGGCFSNCTNLSSITISSNTENIGEYAFSNCTSLVDVYYAGTKSDWNLINVQEYNEPLTQAVIHCLDGDINIKTSDSGNYGTFMGIRKCSAIFHSGLGNQDMEIGFNWGWDYFNKASSEYYNDLAVAGIVLSNAAEYQQKSVEDTLKKLGFFVSSQNYDKTWKDIEKPATTFGYRRVVNSDGDTEYIFAIVIRGTTDTADKLTDITSIAGGFERSANNIYAQFENFITNEHQLNLDVIKNKSKFFVTGHSLGGATGNIIAKKLNDKYSSSNVFAYTFAAPRSVSGSVGYTSNIFNIINNEDQVPIVWSTQTKRYGLDMYFSRRNYAPAIYSNFITLTNGLDLKSTMESLWLFDATPFLGSMSAYAHAPETYLAYLMSRGDGKHISAKTPRARFRCPVDIEVYTSQGLLVGRIVNNTVDNTVTTKTVTYIHVEGDEKTIYLPYEGEYIFKLTGTGTGLMEYTTGMVDLSTDETDSNDDTVFKNVVLAPGKKMTSEIKVENGNVVGVDTQNVELYVVDNDGIPIKQVLPDDNGTEIDVSHTITFNANGGTVEPKTMATGDSGKLPSLPIPVRNDFTFEGWFTEATGGDQITVDTIFTSDSTIYAHWRLNNTDNKPSDNNPNSPNIPSDNDPNVPSVPSDNNGSNTPNNNTTDDKITNTNTSPSNTDTVTKQVTKSPKTVDATSNISLFVSCIGVLMGAYLSILIIRKKYARK